MTMSMQVQIALQTHRSKSAYVVNGHSIWFIVDTEKKINSSGGRMWYLQTDEEFRQDWHEFN